MILAISYLSGRQLYREGIKVPPAKIMPVPQDGSIFMNVRHFLLKTRHCGNVSPRRRALSRCEVELFELGDFLLIVEAFRVTH